MKIWSYIPIPRKGNSMMCKNYRNITLLNVAYKVLITSILSRLRMFTDKAIENY